jgi:hypothetical protein
VITSPKGTYAGLPRFWIVIIRPYFALETQGRRYSAVWISRKYVREIFNEPSKYKREKMQALLSDYGVVILPVTEEIERLAAIYVQEKAIAPVWITDAAHIATATYNGLDFIVSLNFTHIARPWTIEKVRQVNVREKYQAIGIYKPAEVLEIYEDSKRLF